MFNNRSCRKFVVQAFTEVKKKSLKIKNIYLKKNLNIFLNSSDFF